MFFSAKEAYQAHLSGYHGFGRYELEEFDGKDSPVTLSRIKKYISACKRAIVERQCYANEDNGDIELYKWHRPWDVVEKLKSFSAPDGEYAVGIEVEMGFNSRSAASFIAKKVQHWKYIALDYEGGDDPIEATFPPFLYSKMGSKQQPFRYLKVLRDNSSKVYEHEDYESVGTHVNVSKGGCTASNSRTDIMRGMLHEFSVEECEKYFGREPYGYCNTYGGNGKYIEFKLFNSTTDSKKLRKYIHVAVALADIIYGDQEITLSLVRSAVEAAHNKR